jgi:hemolysin-activating ACP:hemolysin acyltransferase
MSIFTPACEKTLRNTLALANERRQGYATLEHMLSALIDDPDASAVLQGCNVDLDQLRTSVTTFIDGTLNRPAVATDTEVREDAGCQRVIQRAVIRMHSSGRAEVTGANILLAILCERESHAYRFLQEQEITRYDAANFVVHGIRKRQPRPNPMSTSIGKSAGERVVGLDGQIAYGPQARIAAGVGALLAVFARSPEYAELPIRDFESIVRPAVLRGQFFIAYPTYAGDDAMAPIGAATWAFVSDEIDARIRAEPESRLTLAEPEWNSGDHAWLIHLVDPELNARLILKRLAEGAFKSRPLHLSIPDGERRRRTTTLAEFL